MPRWPAANRFPADNRWPTDGQWPTDKIWPELTDGALAYYVSNTGNDAADGTTEETAIATLAQLVTLQTGAPRSQVFLDRGSTFRESYTPANSVSISAYGTGARPILDCRDIATNASFVSEGSGAYSYSWAHSLATDGTEEHWAWEGTSVDNAVMLTQVSTLAECQALPGSFCADPPTASPNTIIIHPRGSTNPTTDGKVYLFRRRSRGIKPAFGVHVSVTGVKVVGFAAQGFTDCTRVDCVEDDALLVPIGPEFWANGGFYDVKGLTPQGDNTPIVSLVPIVGSVTATTGTNKPLYRLNTFTSDGRPSIEFKLVGSIAQSTHFLLNALAAQFSGDDAPFFFAAEATFSGNMFLASLSSNAGTARARVVSNVFRRTDDANASGDYTIASYTPGYQDGSISAVFATRFSGALSPKGKAFIDDQLVRTMTESADVGVATFDRLTVGLQDKPGSANNLYIGRMPWFGFSSRTPTDEQIKRLRHWKRGVPRRIWTLGDSITVGETAKFGGWRKRIWRNIVQNDYRAIMVGSLEGPAAVSPQFSQDYSNAVGGSGFATAMTAVTTHMAALKPSLITILIGTNETGSDTTANLMSDYEDLLDAIYAIDPTCLIALSPITPDGRGGKQALTLEYNAALLSLRDTWDVGKGVMVRGWDAFSAVGGYPLNSTYINSGDLVHPLEAGYDLIADHAQYGLWQAIQPIVSKW